MQDVIIDKGPPPMLLFGASHVNHFSTYLKAMKPQDKVKRVFSNTYFVGVGGTTWAKVLNDVQGLNPNKPYLTDQWRELKDTGFKPRYIILVCGSNTVDSFHRRICNKRTAKWAKSFFWKYADKIQKSTFEKAKTDIDEVLEFLSNEFPEAEFLYSKILPRSTWCFHARWLARWLDYYLLCTLRKTRRIKEIWARDCFTEHYQFNEIVDYGMLTTDTIHLNVNGNRAFASAILKPVLHKWKWAKID